MTCKSRRTGVSPPVLAVIALYGLVLLAGPALHHDFACHQNSRTHCTSCVSSQFASGVESDAVPVSASLRAAGKLELRQVPALDTLPLTRTTSRSPPA